jgi:WS/DGAT/MGAT family acyltransferase
MGAYERLSGLDECFLGFETANTPIHVAVTGIFDPGPMCGASGEVDIEGVRAHIGDRLDLVPRFRQRLAHVPVVGDAVWIDDEHFDLKRHVRRATLPRPGTTDKLRERCAEIIERPLDRRRPLWEAWVVDGLADGGFAFIVKVHHCIVDGIAGIGMLAALLDLEATPPSTASPAWQPRSAPSPGQLLRDEVGRRLRATVDLGGSLTSIVSDPRGSLGRIGSAAGSLWHLARTGLSPAPEAHFNQPIGPHREIAWLELELAHVKSLARTLGGTVNDVVLTAVSGAIGAALRQRGEPVPGEPLRAVIPVSVRKPEELGAPGNRVSLWLVPLPVHERDARRRFHRIHATTAELKASGVAAGGAVLAEAANWAGGAVIEAAARLVSSARIYNLIVTNVPGPDVPLYLAGSRMRAVYPHLPLFEQQGLGVAVLSYVGRLAICIAADWDLRELLHEVMKRLDAGIAELTSLAGLAPETAAPTISTRLHLARA